MSENSLKLKIAYLYPDIMEGFCDRGNIETFIQRASWRDINVSVYEINSQDKIVSSKFDFYYIGGANLDTIEIAKKSLSQNKEALEVVNLSNIPILALNCGYMLFGNYYQLNNKKQSDGLKILDVDFVQEKRFNYGVIHGTCSFLDDKTIAGFENHSIMAYLKANVEPILKLKKGFGNNSKDKTFGAKTKSSNVFGCFLTSPVLAQNPHFCDYLLKIALQTKYRCEIPLENLIDDIEGFSHSYLLNL